MFMKLAIRRRIKVVMDVLDSMIRSGVSPARSVELPVQWKKILRTGPVYSVILDDLQSVQDGGIGEFRRVTGNLHCKLTDLIRRVVVYGRDEAIRGWRYSLREDPLFHPYGWLRSDMVLPAPFLQCKPYLAPGGSGVLADPARIDEEFRKAWLPHFSRSGQREASIDEFSEEVDSCLPLASGDISSSSDWRDAC